MPQRKRNFRWVKWLIFLVLIVAAIVMVILVKNNFFDKNTKNEGQQNIDGNSSEEGKPEEKPEDNKEGTSGQEEKAPQYDGDSPNASETLTGMITYANVVDDELVMRVNIDQFLQSGNCNLTMSRNGITYYNQSVAIQESVTTSTCDGYKIPVSQLPKGDLQVEINLDSEGKSGKIVGRVRI